MWVLGLELSCSGFRIQGSVPKPCRTLIQGSDGFSVRLLESGCRALGLGVWGFEFSGVGFAPSEVSKTPWSHRRA